MIYNKDLHQKLIDEYRSEENLKRVKQYQANSEDYFEEQKNYNLYAKIIERDIIKPYLKQNEVALVPLRHGKKINGVFAGVFALGAVLTPVIAHLVNSPLPSWSLCSISGFFGGLVGTNIFRLAQTKQSINNRKNKNYRLAAEWNQLKDIPKYVESFMTLNDITIDGAMLKDDVDSAHIYNAKYGLISPIDHEWM